MKKTKRGRAAAMARPATGEELARLAAGEDKAFDVKELMRGYRFKSVNTIYSLVHAGVLPKPVRIGTSSRWLASEMTRAA